jgi:ubiquinone/menaquinone biosynthesis C-methylase UbiE
VSDTRDEVQRRFGAAAERYVQSADHARGESLDRLLELTNPAADWRVLDVATGGGHAALALAPRVREVVATDLTRPMLEAAERFVRGQGVSHVRFQHADAGALPFEDGSFDLVTCRIAAHHFPDCAAFVKEATRVVRPNGLVAVIDNVVPEDPDADHFINDFEKLRDPSHERAYTEREWGEFFRDAGLKIENLERFRKPRHFATWSARMAIDMETEPELEEKLRTILLGATGIAREWLAPQGDGSELQFHLAEILILGRRPS